ncbi:hypothetical protein [Aquabacterium sp.]|uniref:hypothetical protein n=1 Tax=Aquabacterium sp. TaxID=1872578 RepID=UPI0024871CF7|nr:hypothetical protein [Aquabacterium sp.]MDI1258996.1 hypothetical protein [Aquabacterium sp.]
MKKDADLDRLIHRATKFPDPTPRLSALKEALKATEESIEHLIDQYPTRSGRILAQKRMHQDDVDLEILILQKNTEELFPRVFRGGFLVSLWAVFESGIKDLAEYTRNQRNLPFGLQDLRGGDFLEQSERFFRATLQIEPFPEKGIRKRIEYLKGFRNAIAHHDGNILEMPKYFTQNGRHFYQEFSDFHHTFAVPTFEYNAECIKITSQVSSKLAEAVYERLHPVV